MSDLNCSACNDLREYAPDFVQNGVTETICTSLENDTGLNPNLTTLHTDCEDLHDVNDCLIGRADGELESYEVCDWKKFMHRFLPNLYETIKAIICTLCGAWTKLHDHDDQLADLCVKVDQALQPNLTIYGSHPYQENTRRVFGTIGTKNGSPLIIVPSREDANPYSYMSTGIGISYLKRQLTGCEDRKCKIYEWIMPQIYDVQISGDVEDGDILWYCTKQELEESFGGISDYLWYTFTITSWTWTNVRLNSTHQYAWIQMTIEPDVMGDNYLTLVYRGTSYPNTAIPTQAIRTEGDDAARVYIHNCDWVRPS